VALTPAPTRRGDPEGRGSNAGRAGFDRRLLRPGVVTPLVLRVPQDEREGAWFDGEAQCYSTALDASPLRFCAPRQRRAGLRKSGKGRGPTAGRAGEAFSRSSVIRRRWMPRPYDFWAPEERGGAWCQCGACGRGIFEGQCYSTALDASPLRFCAPPQDEREGAWFDGEARGRGIFEGQCLFDGVGCLAPTILCAPSGRAGRGVVRMRGVRARHFPGAVLFDGVGCLAPTILCAGRAGRGVGQREWTKSEAGQTPRLWVTRFA
jgi:hypothetical protein